MADMANMAKLAAKYAASQRDIDLILAASGSELVHIARETVRLIRKVANLTSCPCCPCAKNLVKLVTVPFRTLQGEPPGTTFGDLALEAREAEEVDIVVGAVVDCEVGQDLADDRREHVAVA